MSTEPSPSGPDQQEPVDVAPEAVAAPPAEPTDAASPAVDAEQPASEAPAADVSATEPPGTEPPATEPPATEPPAADSSTTEQPVTAAPATEAPSDPEAPGAEPSAEVPAAEVPAAVEVPADTQQAEASPAESEPTQEEPSKGEPTGEEPSGPPSVVGAVTGVAGAIGSLAKDVVSGAADALLHRRDEKSADGETSTDTTTSTDDAPAAETTTEDAPAAEAPSTDAETTASTDTAPAEDAASTGSAPTPAPTAGSTTPAPRPTSGPVPSAPAHDAPRPSDVMPARAPAAAPAAAATPPLAVGAASFGRVDEAGVVHVQDGDTEREVGQYPDVPHDEALAFYVRKFEDLAAQVHLLGQRLDNGTVPAKEARASLVTLRASATEAKAVGDLPALRTELDRLDGLVAERTKAEDAQRAAARAQALAEREAIVTEAEQIAATPAQSMHFKNAGERMQALLEAWKTAQRSGTRLDKRSEDPLWKRFAAARSTVDRMRRAHFAQVSDQRSETKSTKEQLIARAEELQTSTDWRSASDEYRSLMDRWKSAGRLSRKDDDALWARFRAAQDVFFAARTAANSAQDEEYKANLEVKEKLLQEAEALLPVTDLDRARKALGAIQDRWDDAGRVPRSDLDRIEGRLKAVIDKVREADSAKWGKGTPEVVARGSGLVQQLRQQVADLDTKIAEAEVRGDTRTASRSAKERATKQAWLDQAEASLDDISR